MFCPNCGTQLENNVKFCTNCGAKTEEDFSSGETTVLSEPVPAENAKTEAENVGNYSAQQFQQSPYVQQYAQPQQQPQQSPYVQQYAQPQQPQQSPYVQQYAQPQQPQQSPYVQQYAQPQQYVQPQYVRYTSKSGNSSKSHIVISVLSIAAIFIMILIPFSTGWRDGWFPDSEYIGKGLSDVFDEISSRGTDSLDNALVLAPVLSLACSAFLLIFSLCRLKVMEIITSAFGIVSLLWITIKLISLNSVESVISPTEGGLTIGFWLVFLIFIICFVKSVKIKN